MLIKMGNVAETQSLFITSWPKLCVQYITL